MSKNAIEFQLMPPKKGVCQECAVDHEPQMPHNKDSLYFQYKFYNDHGRWPIIENRRLITNERYIHVL